MAALSRATGYHSSFFLARSWVLSTHMFEELLLGLARLNSSTYNSTYRITPHHCLNHGTLIKNRQDRTSRRAANIFVLFFTPPPTFVHHIIQCHSFKKPIPEARRMTKHHRNCPPRRNIFLLPTQTPPPLPSDSRTKSTTGRERNVRC